MKGSGEHSVMTRWNQGVIVYSVFVATSITGSAIAQSGGPVPTCWTESPVSGCVVCGTDIPLPIPCGSTTCDSKILEDTWLTEAAAGSPGKYGKGLNGSHACAVQLFRCEGGVCIKDRVVKQWTARHTPTGGDC
jgi:hypothetical protein